jgi:cysteine synthase A
MKARGESGAVVMLAGDAGDRYLDTYYDDGWLAAHGHEIGPDLRFLEQVCATGLWSAG